jgi:hypothetical protein
MFEDDLRFPKNEWKSRRIESKSKKKEKKLKNESNQFIEKIVHSIRERDLSVI